MIDEQGVHRRVSNAFLFILVLCFLTVIFIMQYFIFIDYSTNLSTVSKFVQIDTVKLEDGYKVSFSKRDGNVVSGKLSNEQFKKLIGNKYAVDDECYNLTIEIMLGKIKPKRSYITFTRDQILGGSNFSPKEVEDISNDLKIDHSILLLDRKSIDKITKKYNCYVSVLDENY